MKNIKFFLFLMVSVFLWGSCTKDYLDTKPTAEVAPSTIFSTTQGAALAVNGLNNMTTMQYLSSQGFNGEGTIKMYYGNYPGNHFSVNLTGWAAIINSDYHENISSIYLYYPWYYYYKLIGNANAIIMNIDNASGPLEDKQFIKAQALSYRAYSFFMLSQIYCNRWMDSSNGATSGLVLRVDDSSGDMPLSTLAEVYTQVYNDLDEAITLYTESGKTRTFNYEMDINVAYAIYARAALTKQDYTTASTMAVNARAGFPLMTNTEYGAGFCNPNSEWIWSSFGSIDETLYFYSYFAYIAYNSSASAVKSYPKMISRELYAKIPATDIRRNLFLDPTGYTYTTSTGACGNTVATGSLLRNYARTLYPDMSKDASGAFNGTVYAYMQFKIKANDLPGVGHLNHFRSAEMYLIEAEAKYYTSDEPGARAALVALNATSGRNATYTTANTGIALLDEIKTYRAIELWGEGFDWFDLKRWGDSINRKNYAGGGNFVSTLDITYNKDTRNGWIWRIPERETLYNNAIE